MKVQLSRTRLRTHIDELAAAFGVDLDYTDHLFKSRNESIWDVGTVGVPAKGRIQNKVVIALVYDEVTYAAALHELGHACHPCGQLRTTDDQQSAKYIQLKLDEEIAAWEWARHYALAWTKKMQESMDWAYSTHVRSVEQAIRIRDGKMTQEDAVAIVTDLLQALEATRKKTSPPVGTTSRESLDDFLKGGRKP